MASATSIRRPPEQPEAQSLRAHMEGLLFAFYELAGVTAATSTAQATEVLADDFQARCYLRVSAEMVALSRADIGKVKLASGTPQEALYPLFEMELADVDDHSLSIRYVVAFRYGSMVTLRRGLMKVVPHNGKWILCSVEEDVREVLLSAARSARKSLDRPRLWFV